MVATRTFAQVCRELDRRQHITLDLEKIESLLGALGHPEESLRVVQVVGTNGKGTTAVSLAAALEQAGLSTGTYLSPHLLSYTERMMVRGEYVTEERFARVMDRVMYVAEENGIPASQFELLTAGALELFREAGAEWAILEAGLGARYDATTAAAPETVVLTNVGLDHTEYLGDTLDEIAREKLASLSRGGLLVLGDGNPEVVRIAHEECQRSGARIIEVDPSQSHESNSAAHFIIHNTHLGIRTSEELLGRLLGSQEQEQVFLRSKGALPGRFETHEMKGVPVIVDGGHNPGGLEATLGAIRDLYEARPLGVVFGVLRDKDIRSMLVALEAETSYLVLVRPQNERAAEPEWIAEHYGPRDQNGRGAEVVADVDGALDGVVREMKRTGGIVLVTGSLSTGVPVLRRLREG